MRFQYNVSDNIKKFRLIVYKNYTLKLNLDGAKLLRMLFS